MNVTQILTWTFASLSAVTAGVAVYYALQTRKARLRAEELRDGR